MRERVLLLIESARDRGMTCDEVEVSLDSPHQSVSAVFNALKREGRIRPCGSSRLTRARRKADVYVLVLQDCASSLPRVSDSSDTRKRWCEGPYCMACGNSAFWDSVVRTRICRSCYPPPMGAEYIKFAP